MPKPIVDARLLIAIAKVTGKRPRTVLDHILEHGHITTEELANYGYNHPPRAARDVREAGIPLETFKVIGRDGRYIAAYRLGDPEKIEGHKLAGRSVLPRALADALYLESGGRCHTCFQRYEQRYLQVDHRIPYEIAGDQLGKQNVSDFMLLCGSCQRKKSWSCEHCPNWIAKAAPVCASCFWCSPADYEHVATRVERRLEIVFSGEEVVTHDRVRARAVKESVPISEYIKRKICDD